MPFRLGNRKKSNKNRDQFENRRKHQQVKGNLELVNWLIQSVQDVVLSLQSEVHNIRTEVDQRLQNVGTRIESIGTSVKKNSGGSFLWAIENLYEQQSDAFYSHENGYKMRLQLRPERHWIRNGIVITMKMVQGANDKSLQWPVEFDVRIGIVNQDSGHFFRSQKQIILFRTSTSTHEFPFRFTPYDLSGSAWKNKALLIKCLVN